MNACFELEQLAREFDELRDRALNRDHRTKAEVYKHAAHLARDRAVRLREQAVYGEEVKTT